MISSARNRTRIGRIKADQIDAFRERFCEHVTQNHVIKERDLEIRVDAEIRLTDLTLQSVQDLDRLGPFGRSNPRPVLSASGVKLAEAPRKMGEGDRHLAITVVQAGRKIRGVCFGRGEWADEIAAAGPELSICFAPTINQFRGQNNVEFHLLDWKPASAATTANATGVSL